MQISTQVYDEIFYDNDTNNNIFTFDLNNRLIFNFNTEIKMYLNIK